MTDIPTSGAPGRITDGTKIAFTGKTATGSQGIWVVNTDGSGLTQFTDDGQTATPIC